MKFVYRLMELLFPPKCILCGGLLKREETDLCRRCRREAPWYGNRKRKAQFLDSFAAVWYYEEYPRKSILRYKFSGKRCYAPAYGRLLAAKLLEMPDLTYDCITWVPVSRLRRFARGYDQGQLLAEAVSRELGIASQCLLKKIRHNRRQSGIHGEALRRANVMGVYRVTDAEAVRGKRILLVDDVMTTGATAGECARMLRSAGAKEVHCAALAAPRK